MEKKTKYPKIKNGKRDSFKITLPTSLRLKEQKRQEKIRKFKDGMKEGFFVFLLIIALCGFIIICKGIYFWIKALISFIPLLIKEIPLILNSETSPLILSLWFFANMFILIKLGSFFAEIADYLLNTIIKLIKELLNG
jgi:hypothetical protein